MGSCFSTPTGSIPPTPPTAKQTLSDLYAYWSEHGYELINNLWGKDSATSGSQCTYLDDASSSGVAWRTTWTWLGAPDSVKSYPYAGRQFPRGRLISGIERMPAEVNWQYEGEKRGGIRANVAFDLFTARDKEHANHGGDFELMVWLARYGGVCPIGKRVGEVHIGGRRWELWDGYNGAMRVWSFVPPRAEIRGFKGDMRDFFGYLEREKGFPAGEQNLIVFQIGTECFTGGPATFTCTRFSADVI